MRTKWEQNSKKESNKLYFPTETSWVYTLSTRPCRPLLIVFRWLQMSLNRLFFSPRKHLKSCLHSWGKSESLILWGHQIQRGPLEVLTSQVDNTETKIWTVSPAALIVCSGLPSCWRKEQSLLELVTWFGGRKVLADRAVLMTSSKPLEGLKENKKAGGTKALPTKQVYLIGLWELKLVWRFVPWK